MHENETKSKHEPNQKQTRGPRIDVGAFKFKQVYKFKTNSVNTDMR